MEFLVGNGLPVPLLLTSGVHAAALPSWLHLSLAMLGMSGSEHLACMLGNDCQMHLVIGAGIDKFLEVQHDHANAS